MAKQALGKGLGALIRKTQTAPEADGTISPGDDAAANARQVREVPLHLIVASPLQPRKQFSDPQIDDLVDSIRQHGIIQPLIVRPVNGKFELIAGERRWRASKKLGLETAPVIERAASDRDVLEMALIENLQREDLNPIEEAAGYVRLAKEFTLKQDEIAKRVGKSRASVANAMRLLDLHPDIQPLVAGGSISVGHAKALLSIKDRDNQILASDQILRRKLTVRAAEKLAQSFAAPAEDEATAAKPKPREIDVHVRALINRMREHFSTHVNIHHSPKKGRIEIEYYGDDDLNRLLELLGLPTVD